MHAGLAGWHGPRKTIVTLQVFDFEKPQSKQHKEVATALIMHFLCTAAKINLICASDECLMRPPSLCSSKEKFSITTLLVSAAGVIIIIILNARCWV